MTTEQFIAIAREVHKNHYDYSLTEYAGRHAKVIIGCIDHGRFEQEARSHLRGRGCRRCGAERRGAQRALGTAEFTARAIAVHGSRYDYGAATYTNSATKVLIRCPDHGQFSQAPGQHLVGRGCPKCGRARTGFGLRLARDRFVSRAVEIHGDRFDYTFVVYTNMRTKVLIGCAHHGLFVQAPGDHLRGRGCPLCAAVRRPAAVCSPQDFAERANAVHHGRYDYRLVKPAASHAKVTIVCPAHGPFEQEARYHLRGHGCRRCARINFWTTRKTTRDDFIARAHVVHGDRFDYGAVTYVDTETKVVIRCREHGRFRQTPESHLSGSGCPRCKDSRGEREVARVLDAHKVRYVREWRHKSLRLTGPLSFDFALEEQKVLIEFDGVQHAEPSCFFAATDEEALRAFELQPALDRAKDEWAREHGWTLIRLTTLVTVEAELIKHGIIHRAAA